LTTVLKHSTGELEDVNTVAVFVVIPKIRDPRNQLVLHEILEVSVVIIVVVVGAVSVEDVIIVVVGAVSVVVVFFFQRQE